MCPLPVFSISIHATCSFFFFSSDCKEESVSNCNTYIDTHTFIRKSLKLRTIPLGIGKSY